MVLSGPVLNVQMRHSGQKIQKQLHMKVMIDRWTGLAGSRLIWNSGRCQSDIKYAVIDTVCSNDAVTSIGFKEWEGAYVLGTMMATAFPEENKFGYICSIRHRQLISIITAIPKCSVCKSLMPSLCIIIQIPMQIPHLHMNMRFSSRQQDARSFMGGASSSSNAGIYQAALELADQGKTIYTTGLSIDQTTEENPYILGGLLKNTNICTRNVVENYLNGHFEGGSQLLG